MTVDIDSITEKVQEAAPLFQKARDEVHKVIVGQKEVVKSLFLAVLSDGHILVEGLPGLAKTLAVNTMAKVVSCDFKRIQFTPDLLPADLIGTTIYNQNEGQFTVKKGPVFTNILLADEINRAPPKVQAALLEVMQERQVTIGGESFKTGTPFLVMATQNPVEQEGTYSLPEAQTDRFMLKVLIDYPTKEEEKEIIARMGKMGDLPSAGAAMSGDDILKARRVVDSIFIDEKVTDYILDIVFATRTPERHNLEIGSLIQFGASPRASIAMQIAAKAEAFLEGRGFVTPDDIKSIAHEILRHRIRISYEAEAEGVTSDDLIDQILSTIPVP